MAGGQPGVSHHAIGLDEPQLFVDDHLIENRYTEDVLSARVPHVLHPPFERRRVLAPDEAHPWELGGMTYPSVLYDPLLGRFRMYYQLSFGAFGPAARPAADAAGSGRPRPPHPTNPGGRYATAYAESEDGLTWERPFSGHIPYREHPL
ncbi:MAG TPA: hypothetical protein VH257_18315, partial [Chloroflexota bacterium]|nr:hypothetical protein [Chloroflexota bacterium]